MLETFLFVTTLVERSQRYCKTSCNALKTACPISLLFLRYCNSQCIFFYQYHIPVPHQWNVNICIPIACQDLLIFHLLPVMEFSLLFSREKVVIYLQNFILESTSQYHFFPNFLVPTFTDQCSKKTDTEIMRFAYDRLCGGHAFRNTPLRV